MICGFSRYVFLFHSSSIIIYLAGAFDAIVECIENMTYTSISSESDLWRKKRPKDRWQISHGLYITNNEIDKILIKKKIHHVFTLFPFSLVLSLSRYFEQCVLVGCWQMVKHKKHPNRLLLDNSNNIEYQQKPCSIIHCMLAHFIDFNRLS